MLDQLLLSELKPLGLTAAGLLHRLAFPSAALLQAHAWFGG
jgi:hypothetical protein